MPEKAEQLQKSSMADLIEALADMNQVYERLNDAMLNAQASNIVSNSDKEHQLEGECRRALVLASDLRHGIGDILNEHNTGAG